MVEFREWVASSADQLHAVTDGNRYLLMRSDHRTRNVPLAMYEDGEWVEFCLDDLLSDESLETCMPDRIFARDGAFFASWRYKATEQSPFTSQVQPGF
jgi:hypothetical protein